MNQKSVKKDSKIEKEIITNALLEASQTLLNKINNNINQISELELKIKKGEKISEKGREPASDKTSFLVCEK